jgi:hypothetical protein
MPPAYPVSAAPVPPVPSAPPSYPVSAAPVTAYPTSGTPTTAYPIPAPPAPASYYPPPAYPAPGYPPTSYPPAYPPGYGYAGAYPAVDPTTGVPYSDKSKMVAGLLQLLIGFFLVIGGVGRLYAGNTSLGITQLVLSIVSWFALICGFVLVFPIVTFFGLWVWFWVDGIIVLAGRPVDGQGRPLRP